MLVDQSTDEMFVPLNTISEQQKAFLEVQVMVICTIIIAHSSQKNIKIWSDLTFLNFMNGNRRKLKIMSIVI